MIFVVHISGKSYKILFKIIDTDEYSRTNKCNAWFLSTCKFQMLKKMLLLIGKETKDIDRRES